MARSHPTERPGDRINIGTAADLGPSAVLRIARTGAIPELSAELTDQIAARRARVQLALDSGEPVYGVTLLNVPMLPKKVEGEEPSEPEVVFAAMVE